MTDPAVSIRPANANDLGRVEALLDANGLPSAAVRTEPDRLLVVSTGTKVVGAGGVVRYGSNGLLRSVVVEASHRERGCGTALVDALEARARTNGVTTLVPADHDRCGVLPPSRIRGGHSDARARAGTADDRVH